MMFPILAGYIAMALADRPALMPGIVGGLLAKSGMTMAAEETGWVSSGFFGALIAGFAAGLIMLGLKKILEKLPKALEGTKPMLLYPFLGIAAMGALMVFVVNPPVGAFNEWLNQVLASMGESSRVLLGAVLGGMVPPIGIALATLFFKNRFTRVNSRQWQRISLWDFPLSQRGQSRLQLPIRCCFWLPLRQVLSWQCLESFC
jgi:fructose-specific phosphotransferase system IIC component